MDLNLHQRQGVNHLNRVLGYYPLIAEDGKATVHLTFEDWNVVADTLFRMETPREIVPEAITSYKLASDSVMVLETNDCIIEVEMM